MKVLVACDAHLLKAPDGTYWCDAIYGYDFWKRFLTVFDTVRIAARTREIKEIGSKFLRVDGEGIEIFEIPFFQGPKQLLGAYFSIQKSLKNVSVGCDVALMRMPSPTVYMVYKKLPHNIPVGGEIVYDPTDDLKQKNTSLLMKMVDYVFCQQLKKFCFRANGVSYVTERAIQSHFPSYARVNGESTDHFETYYSTITLNDDAFTGNRNYTNKNSYKLVLSCAAMENDRKGETVLIRCVKNVRDRGYDVSAVFIGDGSKRKDFETLARELGIASYVSFTGMLGSASEVRAVLLDSDIFVFPTQAEGLPRGVLEAMATGMPVLSTPVGGIPEVLDDKYMFAPKDVEGFSDMICHLIDNPEEMNLLSIRNFEKSKEYSNVVLQEKREVFYRKLKKLAEKEAKNNVCVDGQS